jgi:hypothetical protein
MPIYWRSDSTTGSEFIGIVNSETRKPKEFIRLPARPSGRHGKRLYSIALERTYDFEFSESA